MRIITLISVLLMLSTGNIFAAPTNTPPPTESRCTSTREFVTTLEYLRAFDSPIIGEENARKTADTVAKACTGAALRFIQAFEVFSKVEPQVGEALRLSTELSQRTDAELESFLTIFKIGYLKDYLDLDFHSSMNLAKSLTEKFNGSMPAVRDDFVRLVDFCVGTENLDLPRPLCAEKAAEIARKGEPYSGGVADEFIRAFEFARAKGGADRSTGEALKIAEALIETGPGASENFIQGFRYASSKTGLRLSGEDSLKFALAMAQATDQAKANPSRRNEPDSKGKR